MVRLDNGLLEIPVTVFRSLKSYVYSRFDKMDVENNFSEFKYVLDNIMNHDGYNVVVLFAHSFSLIDWKRNPDGPNFNRVKYNKFYNQIAYSTQKYHTNWTCLDDILSIDNIDNSGNGCFFTCKGFSQWHFFFIRAVQVLKDRIDVIIRKRIG